jgi:membrane protein
VGRRRGRRTAILREGFGLVRDTFRAFLAARGLDHAASISFFALLSLAPTLVLMVSLAGFLAPLLGRGDDNLSWLTDWITGTIQSFTPVEGDQVQRVVEGLVARRVSLGLWGGAMLVIGASAAFSALEHAVADALGVAHRRAFLVTRLVFASVIVAGGILAFGVYHAWSFAQSIWSAVGGRDLSAAWGLSPAWTTIWSVVQAPLGFLLALYLPGMARIPWRCALGGALLFTGLWQSARLLYAFYVGRVATYGVLYGSLAAPLLVVLWTFYASVLFLFAAVFTGVLWHRRGKTLA